MTPAVATAVLGILTLIKEAAAAAANVEAILSKARDEDRDITESELNIIAAATDQMHANITARLAALKAPPG